MIVVWMLAQVYLVGSAGVKLAVKVRACPAGNTVPATGLKLNVPAKSVLAVELT